MRVVKDRRSSLRVEIHGEVIVYTEHELFETWCLDLGMDGMRVRSDRPTHTRRLVTLEAFLGGERFRLDAELSRHEPHGAVHELAFSFVDVLPHEAGRLERVIMERLSESSQRDYAQAFQRGALGGSGAGARAQVPPGPEPGGTQVARRPSSPVISGFTEIIDAEAPKPSAQRTEIAPAGIAPTGADECEPRVRAAARPERPEGPGPGPGRGMGRGSARDRTVVVDLEAAAVRFDESWDEDEIDTAKFRRITDDVGPGHTVRMGPDGQPLPPEDTVVMPVAEQGGASCEVEPGAGALHGSAEVTPPGPLMSDPVGVPPGAQHAEQPGGVEGSTTLRLPFAAGLLRSRLDASGAVLTGSIETEPVPRTEETVVLAPEPGPSREGTVVLAGPSAPEPVGRRREETVVLAEPGPGSSMTGLAVPRQEETVVLAVEPEPGSEPAVPEPETTMRLMAEPGPGSSMTGWAVPRQEETVVLAEPVSTSPVTGTVVLAEPVPTSPVTGTVVLAEPVPTPAVTGTTERMRVSPGMEPARGPEPPPLLRGELVVPDPEPRPAVRPVEPSRGASLRPSQRALEQARALLRPRAYDGAPPRRPRVIVLIPHQTYPSARRRASAPR